MQDSEGPEAAKLQNESYRLSWQAGLLVAAYAGSVLLLDLGGHNRVLTYHEVVFAQPAREMVATGNWLLPTFNGVPFTHKPPGTHWAIACVMSLTGSHAESVARLPSVLAGVLTGVLTAVLAARWFGEERGVLAGLMLVTSWYVCRLARLAECDMLLTCAVTGAMYFFALANVDSPRGRAEGRWPPAVFYLCCTLAYFCKGLPGPVFIASGCGLYLSLTRQKRTLRFLCDPVGLTSFLVCTAGWFSAVCWRYPPYFDEQVLHHFGRFRGDLGGEEPTLYYVYGLLLYTVPWTPFVVAGIVVGLRRRAWRDPICTFAACWVLPGLAILWASRFKHTHYLAPLMPPFSLVGALAFAAWNRQRRGWTKNRLITDQAVVQAVVLAAAVAVHVLQPRGTGAVLALLAVLAGGLLLAWWFEFRGRPRGNMAAVFGTCWLLLAGVFSFVMPHHDSYRHMANLAAHVNRVVPEHHRLFLVQLPENQIAYYLHPELKRVDGPIEFLAGLEQHSRDVYVLAPAVLKKDFAIARQVNVLGRCASIRRFESEADRLTLMRLSIRPEGLASTPSGATQRR